MLPGTATTESNLATYFVDRNVSEGRGGHVALLTAGAAVTYSELAELVNKVGNALTALGVVRGDRVLLALSDGVEFVATWYACQKLGLVTAECYTFLQPKDYAYYVTYTEAVVVVADATTLPLLRSAVGLLAAPQHSTVVVGADAGALVDREHAFSALVDAASGELAPSAVAPRDVAVWKFTTGSTGNPKACVHPASSPLASFQAYAVSVLGLTEDDVVLPVPKLFFGYARDLAAMFPLGVGGAGVIFPERTTAERIFELIAAFRPTILVNVPTMMSAMLSHPEAASQDLTCLRCCTSAGEALPAELHRRWLDTFGVEVLDGIGSSEAYHIYVSNRPGRARIGTVGEPVPGYTVRILGDDDHAGTSSAELPDGEIGRLAVTGPSIALGYHGDPERSRRAFLGDTVVSEDLFVRGADGYLSYRGRADDLLKVSGIWVAPTEVEECLLTHPAVVECAVVGKQADGLTRPVAYVVATEAALADSEAGRSELAEDLRSYVRARLSPHKCPREVLVVPQLPRTANGKLDRKALREGV